MAKYLVIEEVVSTYVYEVDLPFEMSTFDKEFLSDDEMNIVQDAIGSQSEYLDRTDVRVKGWKKDISEL